MDLNQRAGIKWWWVNNFNFQHNLVLQKSFRGLKTKNWLLSHQGVQVTTSFYRPKATPHDIHGAARTPYQISFCQTLLLLWWTPLTVPWGLKSSSLNWKLSHLTSIFSILSRLFVLPLFWLLQGSVSKKIIASIDCTHHWSLMLSSVLLFN